MGGTITHQQMKQVLEDMFHVDSEEADHLFRSLDTDDDNVIAYTEFMAAAMQGRVRVHEAVIRRTFAKFDKDSSGCISVEDLKDVLGQTWEDTENMEELIQEADKDGNGRIDYDEFLAYFQRSLEEEEDEAPVMEKTLSQKKNCQHMANHIDYALAATTPTPPSPLKRKNKKALSIGVASSH